MKALKWINAGAFAAMVTVNALANLIPIGGNTTGQVSQAYPNLFTPAPVTFAIWALIYFLMLVFTIYQFGVFDGGTISTGVREDIGPWFTVSCVLNIAWILFWHNRMIGLSMLCIVLLLITLIMILNRLKHTGSGFLHSIAARTGFSIYYGWIIAATIANISVFLTWIGWNGWGLPADFWTVAVLLIGAFIAVAVARTGGNRTAAMAIMWAYAGILIRHLSPAQDGGTHPYIITAAVLSEIIILIAVLLPKYKPWKLLCCSGSPTDSPDTADAAE